MAVEWAGVGLGAVAAIGTFVHLLKERRDQREVRRMAAKANTIAGEALELQEREAEANRKTTVVALHWESAAPEPGFVVENIGPGAATSVISLRARVEVSAREATDTWTHPGLKADGQCALRPLDDYMATGELDPRQGMPPVPVPPQPGPPRNRGARRKYHALVGWTNPDGTKQWGKWQVIPHR